jgi:beta-galactosidase
MYVGNQRKVFNGSAMAVVRANGMAGKICLTAMSDGIKPETAVIKVG